MICAPPWALGRLWEHVGPLMLRGMMASDVDVSETGDELRDLADRILDGRAQLWLVIQDDPPRTLAAFCTSLMVEDGGQPYVLIHNMTGGDMQTWGALLPPTMDAFATAEGCTSIRYEGRAAWTRVLPAQPVGDGVFERAVSS